MEKLSRDDQIRALRAEKKRKAADASSSVNQSLFRQRKWLRSSDPKSDTSHSVYPKLGFSILTWNILAQGLLRRELFPGSDFLKIKDRVKCIWDEILFYNTDIVCLQELDQPISLNGYDHVSDTGYEKKIHGLAIAYKKDTFDLVQSEILRYDDLSLDGSHDGLTYASHATRNIALIAALRHKQTQKCIIVGTTHLYWQGIADYERARQGGLFLYRTTKFRDSLDPVIPIILAGDFNQQPNDWSYKFYTGQPVDEARFNDNTYAYNPASDAWEKSADLATFSQIQALHPIKLSSAYANLFGTFGAPEKHFGSRLPTVYNERNEPVGTPSPLPSVDASSRILRGDYEPIFTNFTPLWRLTLDYIFYTGVKPVSVLDVFSREQLEPGLPRRTLEPSDHISLGTFFEWTE